MAGSNRSFHWSFASSVAAKNSLHILSLSISSLSWMKKNAACDQAEDSKPLNNFNFRVKFSGLQGITSLQKKP